MAWIVAIGLWLLAVPAFLQIVNEAADGECPAWWVWTIVIGWPIIMICYTVAHILDLLGVPFAKRMFRQP